MIIKYEVPSFLERKFLNKTESECQSILTGALLSNSDTLLKMELDTRISQDTLLREMAEIKELIGAIKVVPQVTASPSSSAFIPNQPVVNTPSGSEAVMGTYVPNEDDSVSFGDDDEDDDFYG